MNRYLLAVLALLLTGGLSCRLKAQQPTVLTDVIHGEIVNIPDSLQYALPSFSNGTLLFKNNTSAAARFNINTINQRVQFISPEGDTLSVVEESNVVLLHVDGRVFYKFSGGYAEVLEPDKDISIAVLKRLKIEDPGKQGAYGMVSHTTSIDSYNSILDSGGKIHKLSRMMNLKCRMNCLPYIYASGKIYSAGRKNLYRIFPEKKDFIQRYLSENKVDFEDVREVAALIEVCTED